MKSNSLIPILIGVSLGLGVFNYIIAWHLDNTIRSTRVEITFDHRVVARVTKAEEKFPHCVLVEYSSHPTVKKLLCYKLEVTQ